MRSARVLAVMACAALVGSGCAGGPDAAHGKQVFDALQSAVETVEAKTAPSVVYVRLKEMAQGGGAQPRRIGGMSFASRSRSSSTMQGIILTKAGHILIPQEAKPDEVGRIEVLVGDTEYSAKILKVDDNLRMTVIKIEPDEALVPVDVDDSVDLKTGAWCVIPMASDENSEYETFSLLCLCTGQIDGRYRQFVLNQMPRNANGAPVVSVGGRIAGIVQGRSVLAMSDLGVDLKELLADAGDTDREEDEEERKGWLGVVMEPVNREYARSHDLPKSGLWVVNVAADSPASACGIREGDLIVGFDGRPLRLSGARARDYLIKTMRAKPGKPFRVSVIRDGKTLALSGTFTKRPEEASLRADDIGVTVKAITDSEYFGNNLFTKKGVLISAIRKGSPAATSSSFGRPLLSQNDVIVEVAGRPTPTLDAFSKALEHIRSQKLEIVQVLYWRGRMSGYAGLKLQTNEDGKGGK